MGTAASQEAGDLLAEALRPHCPPGAELEQTVLEAAAWRHDPASVEEMGARWDERADRAASTSRGDGLYSRNSIKPFMFEGGPTTSVTILRWCCLFFSRDVIQYSPRLPRDFLAKNVV